IDDICHTVLPWPPVQQLPAGSHTWRQASTGSDRRRQRRDRAWDRQGDEMTRRPEAAGPAEPAKPEDMPWYGWGEPEHRHGLSAQMRGLLAEECGLDERHTPPVEPGEVRMRPPGLPEDARRDLAAAVGEG